MNRITTNNTTRSRGAPVSGARFPRGVALALAGACLYGANLAAQAGGPYPDLRVAGDGQSNGELCLVNEGPAGVIEAGPSDYAVRIIILRGGDSDTGGAALVPPPGWRTPLEVTDTSFVFGLEPEGAPMPVAAGEQLCFVMVGIDLFELGPIGVSTGKPLVSAAQ